jgi:hypothetical protein
VIRFFGPGCINGSYQMRGFEAAVAGSPVFGTPLGWINSTLHSARLVTPLDAPGPAAQVQQRLIPECRDDWGR